MSNEIQVPHQHLIAIAEARKELVGKGAVARGENPAYKKNGKASLYLTINDIIALAEPVLLKNDLITNFTQIFDKKAPEGEWQSFAVFFRLRITHITTRDYVESQCVMYSKPDAQSMGKAMTYAKRYLYQNLLMLPTVSASEDNDAQDITEYMESKQPERLKEALAPTSKKL